MPCQHPKKKCCEHLNRPKSSRRITLSSSQLTLTSCPSASSKENNLTCCSQNEESCSRACPSQMNSRESLSHCKQQCYEDVAKEQPRRGLQESASLLRQTPQTCPQCDSLPDVSTTDRSSQNPELLPPCFKELIKELAKSIIAEQANETKAQISRNEGVSINKSSARDYDDSGPSTNIPVPKLSHVGFPNQNRVTTPTKCRTEECRMKNVQNKQTEHDLDGTPANDFKEINCSSDVCGVEQMNKGKRRPKIGAHTSSCGSIECPENACQCHFPPEFKHFGCTGNINGTCSCTKNK